MNICLLDSIVLLFLFDNRLIKKGKKISTRWEYLFFFLFYSTLLFLSMKLMGILDSGYHLIDDHEVYSIRNDFTAMGFWNTLLKWLKNDLHIRFRCTYIIIRVIECYFLGAHFFLWHILYTFLSALSLFFSYVYARKMGCRMWLSYLFSLLIFWGSQMAVFWRLGPQENWGVMLFMLTFILLLNYIQRKSPGRLCLLVVSTLLLSGIKESFLLLLPLLPFLAVLWELRSRKSKFDWTNIKNAFLKNQVYAYITWFIFIINILIIIFYVGTNEINYAGIDTSFGLMDYLIKVWEICLGSFRKYFLMTIIGFFILIIPCIIRMCKAHTPASQWLFLASSCLLFAYITGTQLILHAKSGMYERYLLPATIGFCLFWIIDFGYYVDFFSKIKLVYVLYIFLTISVMVLGTDIWARGLDYGQEGKDTTALFSKITEYADSHPKIISVIGYEADYSAALYLQEQYSIDEVYNVYYSGLQDGIVYDAYPLDTLERKQISFQDADIYIGYPDKIQLLLEEYRLDTADYIIHSYGRFALFLQKNFYRTIPSPR